MSEENNQKQKVVGDTMIVATKMLRPPKAVTSLVVVPRTAEWAQVAWMIVFALIGLMVASIVAGFGMMPAVYGITLGGAFGYIFPQLSPLQDESLAKWFMLQGGEVASKKVRINGRKAKMYIGTFPLKRVAGGRTVLFPSGGKVKASYYDERGFPQVATDKEARSLLREQQKLREKTQKGKNRLQASTSLSVEVPKSRAERRKESQQRSAPRTPNKKKTRQETLQPGIPGEPIKTKKNKRAAKRKR